MYYRCIIRGYYGIDGRERFRYNITRSFHTYLFLRSIPERCILEAILRRVLLWAFHTKHPYSSNYLYSKSLTETNQSHVTNTAVCILY